MDATLKALGLWGTKGMPEEPRFLLIVSDLHLSEGGQVFFSV